MFEEAIGVIDGMDERSYKESTGLLQVIKDNLYMWKSELDEEKGREG